ncbi:MAG: LCP family protein [Lachnospiraceae bacterium]|nr:LCP family protein [Lachnospiraceae bacterium]
MKSRKNVKKQPTKKWIIAIIIIIAIIAVGVIVGVLLSKPEENDNSGKVPGGSGRSGTKKEEKITNFVIFGIDDVGYTPGDIYRSDTIMIVSINQDRNGVKLISVLRDSKVPIKGYEPQKINAAYQLGQASLAIDTLNDNFHLKLRNYITVDFAQMISLIDQINGVDIELTKEEANIVNEQNPYEEYVHEGQCHLNGAQALSYSRIRSIDSDYDRANRQQNVMFAVLRQVRSLGTEKSLDLLDSFLETVESSYFYSDLYDILSPLDMKTMHLTTYTVPNSDVNPEVVGGLDETGSWVWQYDLDKAADYINKLISWE